jgi:hypothetical protein
MEQCECRPHRRDLGFNFVTPGAGYIQYVEGSSAAAGNTVQGRNNYSADPFWGLVEDNSNPGQI